MPWAKLDDGLDEHPKVEDLIEDDELLGLAAVGLWALTLTSSSRRGTDGRVSSRTLRKIAPEHGADLAQRLVDGGLYDAVDGALVIHDFLDFNPSAESAAATTAARSAAGRAGAEARWSSGKTDSKSNGAGNINGYGKSNATGNGTAQCDRNAPVPDPTRPDPDPARRALAREAGPLGGDLAGHIAGVLKRGVDGTTTGGRTPTRDAVAAVLAEHPASEDVVLAVAIDTRSTAQSQDRAPNIVGLFRQKLARATTGASS